MATARMTPTMALNPRQCKLISRFFLWLTSWLNGTEGSQTLILKIYIIGFSQQRETVSNLYLIYANFFLATSGSAKT